MKKLKFKKIDVFAFGTATGNPAGAIYLDQIDQLTEKEMLQIARELKGFVNEVGYLAALKGNHFRLKYYSSERMVPFCGHATVGILYDLILNDPELIGLKEITITTDFETMVVKNCIESEGVVYITTPPGRFSEKRIDEKSVAAALNIDQSAIIETPITVNAGLETLIILLSDLNTTLTLNPDFEQLKQFCFNQKIDIITVYTPETTRPENSYRTRVFAPTFGYLEDPATGSGSAALGYHLLQQKRWDGFPISLEQSGNQHNPNRIKLVFNNNRVEVGGGAVVRIEGEYCLI